MLTPKNLPARNFEEMMAEAITKIPIYSTEWNNFNASDPGMTILEYLMGYQSIQSDKIDELPEAIYEKLLNLLGYTRQKGGSGRVYVEPVGATHDFDIPADSRFLIDGISFETTVKQHMVVSKPVAIFTEHEGVITDNSDLLITDVPSLVYPFSKHPACNDAIYIVFSAPLKDGEKGTFHLQIDKSQYRNTGDEDAIDFVRSLKYEYSTENGFKEFEATDTTLGFLKSGFITVNSKGDWTTYSDDNMSGYVIKISLVDSNIDVAPVLRSVSGFLFELVQKETQVITYTYSEPADVEVVSSVLDSSYIKVFAREKKNGPYYQYEINTVPRGEKEEGRYYRYDITSPGHGVVSFDKADFGYSPFTGKDAIKVVMYNETMMRRYRLGDVLGYDNQEMALPAQKVVRDTFTVIAEVKGKDGLKEYYFLKPDCNKEGSLNYTLNEDDGKIEIIDAGNYIGATLYLGSMAISAGASGNVRAGNEFELVGGVGSSGVRFVNPEAGVGGADRETIEHMRRRMVRDLSKPYAAVLASDYEEIVKTAPGLIIRKTHAFINRSSNDVYVAVLPGSTSKRAELSAGYKKRLEEIIETKRCLGQRVTVVGPRYAAVNLRATVYVKPHFIDAKKDIEDVIEKALNYVDSKVADFGTPLSFDSLYTDIESLECVSFVKDMAITAANPNLCSNRGADIVPGEDVLIIPGEITIKTVVIKE